MALAQPIEQFLARLWSDPVVSKLGAGRLPLLGCTVEQLAFKLEETGRNSFKEFHWIWTVQELEAALEGRIRVCDALCEAGLLYGPPLGKVSEMAAEGESSFSCAISRRPTIYGDELHGKGKTLPNDLVRLGVPTRLSSRYLSSLPVSASTSKDFIEFRKVEIEGKEVECLMAWLPSVRRMLVRALRKGKFNKLLEHWLSAQEAAIKCLEETDFQAC